MNSDVENNVLYQKLFDVDSCNSIHNNIDAMANILISNPKLSIESYIQYRATFIGPALLTNKTNTITNSTNDIITDYNIIQNNNTDLTINLALFRAALYSNIPSMIDQVLQHINIKFTMFNIPHDQIDDILAFNSFEFVENNHIRAEILISIIETVKKGHFESIKHLIENYHLSPTVPIFDSSCSDRSTPIFCDLFYYSTYSTNIQLINYLLPLCSNITNAVILSESICNIAKHGLTDILKSIRQQYNINFNTLQTIDGNSNCIINAAIRANNIDLVEYLIENGCSINQSNDFTRSFINAVQEGHWDIIKHCMKKKYFHFNNELCSYIRPLTSFLSSRTKLTPFEFDEIYELFGSNIDINNAYGFGSLLFRAIDYKQWDIFYHLITKYNADVHCVSIVHGFDLFNHLFPQQSSPNIDILEYLTSSQFMVRSDGTMKSIEEVVNGNGQIRPINNVVEMKNDDNVDVVRWLIKHGAKIDDIHSLIIYGLKSGNMGIVQYLIETYQFDFNQIIDHPANIDLLHSAIRQNRSVEFISYLLSLNICRVNLDVYGQTPLSTAITNNNFNLDIIQLLIKYGAEPNVDDWLRIFNQHIPTHSDLQATNIFKCIDFFETTYGYNVGEYIQQSDDIINTTPLVHFTMNCNNFYSRKNPISFNLSARASIIIYRTLIYRYKSNINIQQHKTMNTVLHHLATNNLPQLIQLTLLYSQHTPNIYVVNPTGNTFLHNMCTSGKRLFTSFDWSSRSRSNDDNGDLDFSDVIDRLIDFL